MIRYADSLFNYKLAKTKKCFIARIFEKPKLTLKSVIQNVGNWLAFCAYITLLSKYQRCSINVDGFTDARSFVSKEASRMFSMFREKLG
jgi:hypothetical protein